MQTVLPMNLPTEVSAKILKLLPTKTVNGNLIARCVYVYDDQEHPGVIFAPNQKEWFNRLLYGQVVKACRVGPCKDPSYVGQLMGTAKPIEEQDDSYESDLIETPSSPGVDFAEIPDMLRKAADAIEALNKHISSLQKQKQQQAQEPTYRSAQEWAQIISRVIGSNPSFREKPFSGIAINAFLDAWFNDFWEGDLLPMHKGLPRWRRMTSNALQILVDCNFLEKLPGHDKFYRLTKETHKQVNSYD